MAAAYDIVLVRHVPLYNADGSQHQYAFDEIRITGIVTDTTPETLAMEAFNLQGIAEQLLPAQMPAKAITTIAATTGAPGIPVMDSLALSNAEQTICPCGDTKGAALGACADSDLQYLAKNYKKSEVIRNAAMLVLTARAEGRTVQK